MSEFLRARETTVGALLKTPSGFHMPGNQRTYEWTETQWGLFWSDIEGVLTGKAQFFFMGSLVLVKGEDARLAVIDGQQRLITASLLLVALRNHHWVRGDQAFVERIEQEYLLRPADESGKTAPRLILSMLDKAFFEKKVLIRQTGEDIAKLLRDPELLDSHKNMAECLSYFCFQIGEHSDPEKGRDLADLTERILAILDQQLGTIHIEVGRDVDAFMVFEVLNDRGKKLPAGDLLRNYLLSVAGEFADDVAENLDAMQESLGRLSPVDFIWHLWCAHHTKVEKVRIYATIKETIRSATEARDYSRELREAAEYYAALHDPQHAFWDSLANDPSEREKLTFLLDFMRSLDAKPQLILLLGVLQHNPDHFLEILDMFTLFVFRTVKVCGTPMSRVERVFPKIVKALKTEGALSAEQIFQRFLKSYYPPDGTFRENFGSFKAKNPMLVRYVLGRLNDAMGGFAPYTTLKHDQADSLEHILPKNYRKTWGRSPKGFPYQPEAYVWRLGNLLLLPKSANNQVGAAQFPEKREVYRKIYDDLAWPLADEVLSQERWTASAIAARQQALADVAVGIWRYPAQ